MKINNILPQDNKFTQIIDTIAKPPKRLYFIEQLPKKRVPAVAIVGSRKPTAYSREVTYQLAFNLAKRGIIIISGMALGSTPLESKTIELLQPEIRDGDELQTESGVSASEFSKMLIMMEISGTIPALGGNQWALR